MKPGKHMKDIVLNIEGMSCGHCINAVSRAVGNLKGVTPRSVRIGRAELQYDENMVNPAQIIAAITEEGYTATEEPAA